MTQRAPQADRDQPAQTPEQAEARLTWESERIAEGDADIAAGRVIVGEEAVDWLDRWTAGEELEDPADA